MNTAPAKTRCDKLSNGAEATPRHWLMLPSDIRKWGQALLHQQCWCWGQDIRRSEGNLLIEHGFSRARPPVGHKGSPTYRKYLGEHHGESCAVTLWGFGMCYSESSRGSVFLSRSGFAPRFSPRLEPSRQAWKAEHLGDFHAPGTPAECRESLCLLCSALSWLCDYETRVLQQHGADYRAQTLTQWAHIVLRPEEVPAEWARLSTLCHQRALVWTRDANGIHRSLAAMLPVDHESAESQLH